MDADISGSAAIAAAKLAGTVMVEGENLSLLTNNSGFITAGSTLTGLVQSTAAGTSYITGGNVGIGTTTPGAKLTVEGGYISSPSQPRVLARHSTTQSVAQLTEFVLNFDSEDIDVGAMHDNVTSNNRITIPAGGGGLYLIYAYVYWATTATDGYRVVRIRKNGIDLHSDLQAATGQTQEWSQTAQIIVEAAPGDYFDVVVRHNSATTPLTIGRGDTAQFSNKFYAVKLW